MTERRLNFALATSMLSLFIGSACGGKTPPLECPEGATVHGALPPHGHRVWCAKPDGTLHGPSVAYHRDGLPDFYRNHWDGKEHGQLLHWWPDGKLSSFNTFVHGVRDGLQISWYPNGMRSSQSVYVNGRIHSSQNWEEDGTLISKSDVLGGGDGE
jgi:hypothetical protein